MRAFSRSSTSTPPSVDFTFGYISSPRALTSLNEDIPNFEENLNLPLKGKKIGIVKAFSDRPNELNWYGEATLSKGDKFMPCDPLFKCFHYQAQYSFYKQLQWTEEHFKSQYLGIVLQSNWNAPIEY